MAYGHGNRQAMKRMVALGVGEMSDAKRAALSVLRTRYGETAQAMADTAFDEDPLFHETDIESVLTHFQKDRVSGFNKAYAEKARIAVTAHLTRQRQCYFNRLVGRLRHVDEKIERKNRAKDKIKCKGKARRYNQAKGPDEQPEVRRRYYSVPVSVQDIITADELMALKALGKDYRQALALFRAVIVQGESRGLTESQRAVLRAIHEQALSSHRCPRYAADSQFVCQIPLDYRLIRNEAQSSLSHGARLLLDTANARYRLFLAISHPTPRQTPIRIPLTLHGHLLKRLIGDNAESATIKGLMLELGPRRIGVELVVERPEPQPDIQAVTHVLGRDFGYANTLALTLSRLDTPLDEASIRRLANLSKAEARDYLASHAHPGDNRVGQWLFSGKKFMDALARRCRQVDALRGEIDHHYKKIHRLRAIIGAHLGLDAHERIEQDLVIADPFVKRLAVKFFRLLDRVERLKQRRHALYRKMAGIKQSWFGFLANVEVRIAKAYKAALVREDLTVMAVEKQSPDYKGRAFNRMINNGAKGQYIRRASDKLQWNGVPEWMVPSYYTSSTCFRHAIVDAEQRKGEVFHCKVCGKKEHADLHAAETIGNYFQLRPLNGAAAA